MKKLLTSLVLFAFATHLFAQDGENDLKNFRFGLLAVPSVNWYKPDDAKKFAKNGSKLGFGWGLQMEFRLNSLISLATGLQVNYDRGTLTFTDTAEYFYDSKNSTVLENSNADTVGSTNWNKLNNFYKLNNRYYKTTYVLLPLYLKMKTKEIGAMTYYGEFGLNTSIRIKNKSKDNVTNLSNKTTSDLADLNMTDDMNILKLGLHIGGGAEYNLSGSTSLFFGLSYNLGFTNVLKKNSKYLFKEDRTVSPYSKTVTVQNAVANNFALTLGILF